MRYSLGFLCVCALGAMPLVGCGEIAGDGKDPRFCVPGDEMECLCDDGSLGLQLCRPDGSGYETCDCDDGAGGAGGEGGAGGIGLGGGGGSSPGESYRTTEELYEELHELAAQHSSIVELVDYGDSYVRQDAGAPSGYDLLALRITAKDVSGPKPVFVIVAGYHGDEVIGTELARRMLHWLVESYDADADATWLVDYHDTWVIPTVSPDTLNVSRSNANLVNLNRNHSFQWVAADGHGEHPASEPEVFHLEELLSEKLTDQRGPDEADAAPLDTVGLFITLHASGSIISWPWAFSDAPAPNSAGLATIGRKLGATLGYDTGQTYDAVYPIHGCATDWIYGTFGVPAFLHEIGRSDRPAFGDVNTDIWPPHLEAMLYEARLARAPYQLGAGPDVRNVSSHDEGDRVRLFAEIDDRDNGGELIAAAELTVDLPPWDPAAVAIALVPEDGQFDSPTELATATMDWDALRTCGQQRHIVFVRGQDTAGHWGPPRATFITRSFSARILQNARSVCFLEER